MPSRHDQRGTQASSRENAGTMFSKLFKTHKKSLPQDGFAPIRPDLSFCVIGDVHGRFDLLTKLVDALPQNMSILCVGDLIDRGDQSKDVLEFVKDTGTITPLMGNHEQLLLNFMKSPETGGRRWLRNGGLQTLESFGVSGVTDTSGGEDLLRTRDHLFDAMGEDMVLWLAGLESFAWSGNVAVVHAGADPHKPLQDQEPETFIWGHPEFRKVPRRDGFWIVHGHTIVDKPIMRDGRISIDTGAYATGHLSAAVITPDGVEFVAT